jgi:4-hydroxy-2-oxoheptanedioate aldolase
MSARARLRSAWAEGRQLVGTFVKLPSPDVVELAAAAGLDLVVVDLEHSALSEGQALDLVRVASLLDLPVLVRVDGVDEGQVNRLLEHGATGLVLPMLRSVAGRDALVAASRYAPAGARSVSLSHRSAGFGRAGLVAHLAAEAAQPPVLVGQIESRTVEPVAEVVAGLDVAFVGTTDLTVALGIDPADTTAVAAEVAAVESAAAAAGCAFGGWAPSAAAAPSLGLAGAGLLLVGSDLQLLGAALRNVTSPPPSPEDR